MKIKRRLYVLDLKTKIKLKSVNPTLPRKQKINFKQSFTILHNKKKKNMEKKMLVCGRIVGERKQFQGCL